uniref:ARAD1B17886p n=1 Tax=Blastobotrys adeninivorans TaxID=409370 RepID=A0A060T6B6_BLAAD
MLRQLTRTRLRPMAAPQGLASYARRTYAAINQADFRPSSGFQVYSEELEKDIRKRLDALPPPGKLFQNPDGTTRNPSDQELKEAAALSILSQAKRMSYGDYFKLSNEQMGLFRENNEDLTEYYSSGSRILDKIPVLDKETGEVTWQIVREKQKEGWEELIYYGYIPGALLAMFFALFLDRETVSDWAMEELRLRVQERYNDAASSSEEGLTPEERKKRDALIVERIISGEYDRLAGLKKAGQDMPSSLI